MRKSAIDSPLYFILLAVYSFSTESILAALKASTVTFSTREASGYSMDLSIPLLSSVKVKFSVSSGDTLSSRKVLYASANSAKKLPSSSVILPSSSK